MISARRRAWPARAAAGLVLVLSAATIPSACAQILGVADAPSTLDDFCRCDALRSVAEECRAYAETHRRDAAFLRAFVDAGCADCTNVASCYERLGAAADGSTCSSDGGCASQRCCYSGGARACCSTCRACSSSAASPAPHCTGLFDALHDCLVTKLAECPSECGPEGPTAYEDPCFVCLYAKADACKPIHDQCGDER